MNNSRRLLPVTTECTDAYIHGAKVMLACLQVQDRVMVVQCTVTEVVYCLATEVVHCLAQRTKAGVWTANKHYCGLAGLLGGVAPRPGGQSDTHAWHSVVLWLLDILIHYTTKSQNLIWPLNTSLYAYISLPLGL